MSGDITQHQMVMEKGKQMRALRLDHFGPPTVLHVQDIARPRAESGEVLVKVYGALVFAEKHSGESKRVIRRRGETVASICCSVFYKKGKNTYLLSKWLRPPL